MMLLLRPRVFRSACAPEPSAAPSPRCLRLSMALYLTTRHDESSKTYQIMLLYFLSRKKKLYLYSLFFFSLGFHVFSTSIAAVT